MQQNELKKQLNLHKMTIFIATSSLHKEIIDILDDKVYPIKIKTVNEVIEDLLGMIEPNALFDVGQELDYFFPLADMALKQYRFLQAASAQKSLLSAKINIGSILIRNRKIYTFSDNYAIYQNAQVVFVNTEPDTLLTLLFAKNNIKYQSYYFSEVKQNVEIVKFNYYYNEIEQVVNKINDLIENNVNKENIGILLVNRSYFPYISLLLQKAQITYNCNYKYPLSNFELAKKLLDYIDTLNIVTSNSINEFLKKYQNELIDVDKFNCLLTLLEKHQAVFPLNEPKVIINYLKYLFDHTFMAVEEKNVGVKIISKMEEAYGLNNLFILGCNEDLINYRSEDMTFPNDYRQEFGFISTQEEDFIKEEVVTKLLKQINNLYISWAQNDLAGEKTLSSLIKQIYSYVEIKENYQIKNTNNLFAYPYLADAYEKLEQYAYFNIANDKLKNYHYLFKKEFNDYFSYDNSFTKLSSVALKSLLPNKEITFSATSLEKYYHCQFQYFVYEILKLRPKNENNIIKFGTMIHQVLQAVLEGENIDILIDQISDQFYQEENELVKKYFQKSLKKLLRQYVEVFLNQQASTKFSPFSLEKNYQIKVADFNLKGFIDNVSFYQENDKTYYIIIDYKSGNFSFPNVQSLTYGYNIQLICYLYLLIEKLQLDISQISGLFYVDVAKKTLKEKNKLIYQGQIDLELASLIDKNFDNLDSFINNKKNTQIDYDKLLIFIDILKTLIIKAGTNVLNGEFNIKPHLYAGNHSCKFCLYNRLCHQNESDVIELGDNDGLDS